MDEEPAPQLPMKALAVGTVLPPLEASAAFKRVKEVLDLRNRGPGGWLDTATIARLVINALRYVDGADEREAVVASRRLKTDPVFLIECVDGYIAALVDER